MSAKVSVLENGLTVITECKPYTRMLNIGIWVKAGSLYETPVTSGLSHFTEHMLFKGTKRRNACQISQQIADRGGTTDAWTSLDHTGYSMEVLIEDCEFAMDILSDMMMNPQFDTSEINLERKVILQEQEDESHDPELMLSESFHSLIYPGQAMSRNILGSRRNIQNVTRKKLMAFHKNFYVGSNLILSAVGNLEHEKIVSLAQSYFGSVPKGQCQETAPIHYVGGFKHINKDCDRVMLGLGFDIPYRKELETAVILMSQILGTGDTSRLYTEIREKKGLVYEISANLQTCKKVGILDIFAECNATNVNEILKLITLEINKLRHILVAEEELNRVKKQMLVALIRNMEQGEFVCGSNAEQFIKLGRLKTSEGLITKIEQVTPEKIREAAEGIFSSKLTYIVHGKVSAYTTYEQLQKMLN